MTLTGDKTIQQAENLSQEALLQRITTHIRQSLELPEILSATVAEVRQLLKSDRIMIYRFAADGSGKVVAESIAENRLPSLQGLHFPADDIPQEARKLYIELGLRSIVDVTSGKIGLSPQLNGKTGKPLEEHQLEYRKVDPCHLEYLKAMGVKASVVVPLLSHDLTTQNPTNELWGLLISHHSQQKDISETELKSLQWVADQVTIAIAQSNLLANTRQQAQREATINRVSSLLHSLPTVEIEQALQEAVAALEGSGGRLYIKPYLVNQSAEFYECGIQLQPFKDCLLEEHPVWEKFVKSGGIDPQNSEPIAIVDLYQTPVLRVITPAFSNTPVRGLLILPLYYHQQFLGSLTVFRNEIETERLWAGQFDPSEKQTLPRHSFEAWRELKKGQSPEWTSEDITLAKAVGSHFAMAIEQYELYQQVNSLNSNLECQVEERTAKLKRSLELQNALKRTTDQIRSTLDLETTLNTLVCDVRELLDADRVVIYRFSDEDSSEPLVETVRKGWQSALNISLSKESLNLEQEHGFFILEDVSQSKLNSVLQNFLNKLQVKANITVPIGSDSQAWGLLSAQICQSPRIWQPEEIQLLQQLADQAAVAIQQAELYQRIRTTATMATKKAKQLERSAKQQKTLFQVISRIRQSLDLDTIFQTTTTALRQLLDADRVAVFRFELPSNYSQGKFVSEDVQKPFRSVLSEKVEDHCFGEQFAPEYQQGKIQAIADVNQAPINDCHREILTNFQVQSNLIVPLLQGDNLWGLLCIHQCQSPRQW
ncbi:MAG: GAF domain-containing protein, partial [Chroococcales cyanobacterium]